MMRPAIFLDRDGVINRNRTDHVKSWAEYEFLPGVLDALRRLAQLEWPVVVISNQAIVGQAVPSYGPARAAAFFKKIECFCFTPQTLAAGETRRMPVLFVLDPTMERDVHTVTLSYTFFSTGAKVQAMDLPKAQPHG